MTPTPFHVRRRLRAAAVLLAAGVACVPAGRAAAPPKATPAASLSSFLGSPTPTSNDGPLPGSTAARGPQPIPVPATDEPAPLVSEAFSWLPWGLVALLTLSNVFAWWRLLKRAPGHGGDRWVFPWSSSQRRRGAREPAAVATEPGFWAADLQRFHDLLGQMNAALARNRTDPASGAASLSPGSRRQPAGVTPLIGGASEFQRVLAELAEIKAVLTHRQQPAVSLSAYSSDAHPAEISSPEFTAAADQEQRWTEQYNSAAEHPRSRDDFLSQSRVFRFGVKNRAERFRDTQVDPVFGSHEQGDYLALPLPGGRVLVFPRFQTPLNRERHQSGAMGTVFHCPEYRPGFVYQRVTVARPAVFEEIGADVWRLTEQGELTLGAGQAE